MSIAELGGGSWVMGILLLIFGLIGLINAYAAFVMWAKAFLGLLERKNKSSFWFWFSILLSIVPRKSKKKKLRICAILLIWAMLS